MREYHYSISLQFEGEHDDAANAMALEIVRAIVNHAPKTLAVVCETLDETKAGIIRIRTLWAR